MSLTISQVPLEIEIPEIDPRSFHVFQIQGENLLFDRSTETTSSISEVAYHLLHQIRWKTLPADAALSTAAAFPGTDETSLLAALLDMQERGFFRFNEVTGVGEEELEGLWNHRPRRIQLLMAEGCNLGCRYCYQWRNGTNQLNTLMPWNVARAAVDYLVWRSAGRNDLQITFFGGEPLLNYPMIQRVVEYCHGVEKHTDRRFTFELITNGTLLTPDVTDYLVEHRFLLFISLDGWKEMHNYNRPAMDGSDDTHDLIVRHATYANEQYEKHSLPKIKVRANLTNRFHDRERASDYLESLGFKIIGVAPIQPLSHGSPSKAALSEEQCDEVHDQVWNGQLESLEKFIARQPIDTVKRKDFLGAIQALKKQSMLGVTCGVCRNTAIVDNRGGMYPCHRYGEMQEYLIGNVFTGLDRKLVLDFYRKINAHSTTECHDCWIRDYCGGGCAWELSDESGKIHHPTTNECRRRRQGVKRSLWLRKEVLRQRPDYLTAEDRKPLDSFDWDAAHSQPVSLRDPIPSKQNAVTTTSIDLPSQPLGKPSATMLPIVSGSSCGSGGCGDSDGSGCGTCGTTATIVDISTIVRSNNR